MRAVFLKLRANIELEGDISIAEREVNFFCENYFIVNRDEIHKAQKHIDLIKSNFLSNTRKSEAIGFIGFISKQDINSIIIKSSFIQEVWVEKLLKSEEHLAEKPFCEHTHDNFYCFIPLFPAGEFLTYFKRNEVQLHDIKLFAQHLSNKNYHLEIEKVVFKSSTSTPHAHGLHKYKAKFFPRLIRTFLITETDNRDDLVILDPFVGSGTSLIEAAFLGYKSIGVDIDKLSCLIAESKVKLLKASFISINEETKDYLHKNGNIKFNYTFPSWISKKFDRSGKTSEKNAYEKEISTITSGLENLNGVKMLFQTAVSDAVSRKFSIRMMGTGVGRFALEISKVLFN